MRWITTDNKIMSYMWKHPKRKPVEKMSRSEQISHVQNCMSTPVTEILSRFRLGLNVLKLPPSNERHRDAENFDRPIEYSVIYWSHKLQKKCWHKDIPFYTLDCATSVVARLKLAPWTMTTFLPGWYEYAGAGKRKSMQQRCVRNLIKVLWSPKPRPFDIYFWPGNQTASVA